jgi:hypothetical protein
MTPPPEDVSGQPARSFNIYNGFGEPLAVLDDRTLLADMARLKQRALFQDKKGDALQSQINYGAPPPPGGLQARRERPRSASAGRKGATTPAVARAAAAAASKALAEKMAVRAAEAAEAATVPLTIAERRDRWLREQRATQKRELLHLEKRWLGADAIVAERRDKAATDAHERVVVWDGRREKAQSRVDKEAEERTSELSTVLRAKDERVEAWRERREEEEARLREEHAQQRLAAGERFAQRLRTREELLQKAEARVAQRAGAMAQIKRAELQTRRWRGEERQEVRRAALFRAPPLAAAHLLAAARASLNSATAAPPRARRSTPLPPLPPARALWPRRATSAWNSARACVTRTWRAG